MKSKTTGNRMKMKITLILSAAFLLALLPICDAQNLLVTNGDTVLTVSNGVVVSSAAIVPQTPPIVLTTNGVVVPQAFLTEISVQTGIPVSLLNMIPLKYMVWIAVIYLILSSTKNIAIILRKVIPDDLQVGNFGLILAHLAGEVNPSIAKLAAAVQPVQMQKPLTNEGPQAGTNLAGASQPKV
jgi:hypothetical protein